MILHLREIKSRYSSKCAGCGRQLKEGWIIYYNQESRDVYCKYCAEGHDIIPVRPEPEPAQLENGKNESEDTTKNESENTTLTDLCASLNLHTELFGSLSKQIRDLQEQVNKLEVDTRILINEINSKKNKTK